MWASKNGFGMCDLNLSFDNVKAAFVSGFFFFFNKSDFLIIKKLFLKEITHLNFLLKNFKRLIF